MIENAGDFLATKFTEEESCGLEGILVFVDENNDEISSRLADESVIERLSNVFEANNGCFKVVIGKSSSYDQVVGRFKGIEDLIEINLSQGNVYLNSEKI